VVDALAVLLEPDRDQLRCSPSEAARRLRLMTLALSSPRLIDTDPLPADEIVSMFLDGLRAHAEIPERTTAPSSIGVPSC
jgi:hypothetical protein